MADEIDPADAPAARRQQHPPADLAVETQTTRNADRPRIGILDDYQGVALACADWSAVAARSDIDVFSDHLADEEALVARLIPFDALCVMRERTALSGALLERLPRLRFIASTGPINAAIDVAAADRLGIEIAHTGYGSTPTIELTWALILASQRHLVDEVLAVRANGWQRRLGRELEGRTLGILGLGAIGGAVARIGAAFGMRVIAWSKHLTAERAAEAGAARVSSEDLFRQADILSIHTLLSRRTRGLIGAASLALMKPDAWLVNTSRGPIVEEAAIVRVLGAHAIGGYAVDVFDEEPLPVDHPFRTLPNVLATPHVGYVAADLYRTFYGDSARNLEAWLIRRDAARP